MLPHLLITQPYASLVLLKLKLSPQTRWKADADYLKKLNPEERRWYAKFVNAYYEGNYKLEDDERFGESERRKINAEKAASSNDVITARKDTELSDMMLDFMPGVSDYTALLDDYATGLIKRYYKAKDSRRHAEAASIKRRIKVYIADKASNGD